MWDDSELFRRIRAGKLGGRCGDCEYRGMCGGCRARAFAVEGDVLAADPACAYQPSGAPLIERQRPVTYGMQVGQGLSWAPDAEEKMKRIPSFVRGVVVTRIEEYARRRGATVVTLELMQEVRKSLPVDFSQRAPFFASDD